MPPPPSPLWPLSPAFPGPALELVRSKLPAPTLGALRLVSRAARDDLVDGRATRVRQVWVDAPIAALASAAPRLRSLAGITVRGIQGELSAGHCAALADALEALPGGGAALRELRLPYIHIDGDTSAPGELRWRRATGAHTQCLHRLAAAIGRLPGLQVLELALKGPWGSSVAPLLRAAARLKNSLVRLGLKLSCHWYEGDAPPLPALLLPPQSLNRLESLRLGGDAALLSLPALSTGRGAAALTRLRDLELGCPGSGAPCLRERLRAAPWRPCWTSQLTRLAVSDFYNLLRLAPSGEPLNGEEGAPALPPPPAPPLALPALRALELSACRERDPPTSDLTDAALRAVLAACDAAALEALAPRRAGGGALREAALALPRLGALVVDAYFVTHGHDAGEGGRAAGRSWRALCDAPLVGLTRLELHASLAQLGDAGLAPLFASDWARALRELSLYSVDASERGVAKLQGLSALTSLTKLTVGLCGHVQAFELVQAASGGFGSGWAPRLLDFRWGGMLDAPGMHALLLLPFAKLERLTVWAGARFSPAQLADFSAACAKALPRLAALEFSADKSC